jgi:transposase
MLTIGLDTHLRTSTLCILDANGKQINTRTIRGHWTRTVEYIRELGERFRIVFEASCGYGPVHDALAALPGAARVVVAHPGRLRLIFRSKRKNDRVDAQKLAKLLYLDETPEAHVPGIDVRAWRELIEFRRRSVDKRTTVKNGIRSLLRAHGVEVPRQHRNLWTRRGAAWLESVTLPTSLSTLRRDLLLDELAHAESVVAKVTRELDAIAAEHAGVQLLMSIPGVGPRTAEAFVAYMDDPHRFARVSRVGAYFGLVPSQDASAGVNRLGHITKAGPATARKLLVEASWQVIRKDAAMRAFFDRVTGGKPDRRKIALIAVAHKLSRCMLAMLRSGETWRATPFESDAADATNDVKEHNG